LFFRISGDVFRSPQKGTFLSVLIGNGVQITITLLITLGELVYFIAHYFLCLYLVFAALGFLSPASRGALMTCYCMFIESLIHRLFKGFGGEKWQNIGGMVSLICPGCDWK
jgi:hypothetical protein